MEISKSALKIPHPHTPDPRNKTMSSHASARYQLKESFNQIPLPSQYVLNLNHGLQ